MRSSSHVPRPYLPCNQALFAHDMSVQTKFVWPGTRVGPLTHQRLDSGLGYRPQGDHDAAYVLQDPHLRIIPPGEKGKKRCEKVTKPCALFPFQVSFLSADPGL